ncbi:MAG: polynucleotide phosphorylase/polyadenylase [Methanoregulaceae archaeon PtaB.Bin009]|jgi:ribosomal RNA assembly protein|nr:MAG: polynucleotide phosphorylase/polyadenylase [Methanoregulaceae archaeon PtaB.Bin009]OPY39937.1 MAG: polynucleotide phosphorylase/polyadenylase [Methanoregulaceae archaeon PtaU1.Bin066]HNQ28556.1 KH domain-containing protein [Methanolinea sp.]
MMQELKVAGNRIGVLIGKGGLIKKELEEKTGTVIAIDSQEGIVRVEGEDAVPFLRAVEVIQAVNRGFSPDRAFRLLGDEDLLLEVIDLSGLADNPRQMDRLRGRIIGRDGRAREQIEHMTHTQISVMGKTIAIIGLPEQMKVARAAIDMLLEGSPHEAVFSYLEKKRQDAKQDMLEYYY